MQVTPLQTLGILGHLSDWQAFARPDFPGYDALLHMNWATAGREAGLRGDPRNPRNGLVLRSRLFEATAPSGERCLGFFLRDTSYAEHGDLFLAAPCRAQQTAFRLRMPAAFASYSHCTDPLTDDTLTRISAHILDDRGTLRSRSFVRARDLWRHDVTPLDPGLVRDYAANPARLAAWSGLTVSKTFDASDCRWAPTPWARFIMSASGHEGALAALRLGMDWVWAEEDLSKTTVTAVFEQRPLSLIEI